MPRFGPHSPIFPKKIRYGSIQPGVTPGEPPVDPPPPVVDFITTMNGPYHLVVDGDHLFIADAGDGVIYVIDKSDPTTLVNVGGFGSLDQPVIALLGSHVYVVQGGLLRAYSISTPTSPTLVGSTPTLVGSSGLVASGNRVYGSSISADRIHNVNVTTPSSPTVTSSLTNATTLNGAHGLAFQGSHLYVACEDGDRLTSVNISVPATMVVADSETHADLNACTDVQINLNYAYAISPTGLVVYDKSTPTALSYVTTVSIPDAVGIEVGGDHAYVITDDGLGGGELVIVDITTPAAPAVIPSATVSGVLGAPRDLVWDDDYLFITDPSVGAVYAFDVSDYP